MDVVGHNSSAWDAEVESGTSPWSQPVSSEDVERAGKGEFSIVLTPHIPVPRAWLPDEIKGKDILCLASGGGQQAPILAAAGAKVTSFDNSPKQLELDRMVADRDGLELVTVRGDAADLSAFEDESFDLVFNPVSNCFFPQLEPVWTEAFRVLRKGGTMLSGFHNGFFYIFDQFKSERDGALEVRYRLPYSDVRDLPKEQLEEVLSEGGALEYGHTLDQQIGGQIRAGFVISGFFEDYFTDEATPLNKYLPVFAATKADKL